MFKYKCNVRGRKSLKKHIIAVETKSCSKKLASYFNKETITNGCKHIAAEEGLCIPHSKTRLFLLVHGLYILSDKKTA
jgi:hypothetical protein